MRAILPHLYRIDRDGSVRLDLVALRVAARQDGTIPLRKPRTNLMPRVRVWLSGNRRAT